MWVRDALSLPSLDCRLSRADIDLKALHFCARIMGLTIFSHLENVLSPVGAMDSLSSCLSNGPPKRRIHSLGKEAEHLSPRTIIKQLLSPSPLVIGSMDPIPQPLHTISVEMQYDEKKESLSADSIHDKELVDTIDVSSTESSNTDEYTVIQKAEDVAIQVRHALRSKCCLRAHCHSII